jgi:hypothetical protein
MAVTTKVLLDSKQLESTQTTQYTAVNCRALITKVTIANNDTVNRTVSVNLVPSAGTAGASNRVINVKTIVPGETYLCPELSGQILESGGFVSTIASAASALTIRINGQEIT